VDVNPSVEGAVGPWRLRSQPSICQGSAKYRRFRLSAGQNPP